MTIVYERLRDRLEEALPRSPSQAQGTDALARKLGTTPEAVAKACRALQRFGAAACRKGPHEKKMQRRTLWWRPE